MTSVTWELRDVPKHKEMAYGWLCVDCLVCFATNQYKLRNQDLKQAHWNIHGSKWEHDLLQMVRLSMDKLKWSLPVCFRLYWSLDIMFSFTTGFYDAGLLVLDLRRTTKNYLKLGWISRSPLDPKDPTSPHKNRLLESTRTYNYVSLKVIPNHLLVVWLW